MLARRISTICGNVLHRKFSQPANNDLIFEYLSGEHDGIATFGLNRPQQKNAVSRNLLENLLNAVDKVAYENQAKVLIIHSLVPGAFCAGNLRWLWNILYLLLHGRLLLTTIFRSWFERTGGYESSRSPTLCCKHSRSYKQNLQLTNTCYSSNRWNSLRLVLL